MRSNDNSDDELTPAELERPHAVTVSVPFPCASDANIVYNSLRVDPEPLRSRVLRTMTVREHILEIQLNAPELRNLRTSLHSLMDLIILACKAIERFKPSNDDDQQEYRTVPNANAEPTSDSE